MTLDEAIEQFKYDAECNRADLDLSFAEDKDKVAEWLEELKQYRAIGTPEECRAAVEKQKKKPVPTSYDVDRVVEQLEDYGNEEMDYYRNTPYEKCIEECVHKAIEIVKGGGVNE